VKPEPSCPTSRQRERTRLGSECLYSTNVRPTSLSRTSIRTRHRSRDFAVVVRLPALIRSMMLAHVRARPRGFGKVTPAQTHQAARRSSTSATKSLCEHDRERSRTPRTTTAVARHRSSGRGWLLRKNASFRSRPTQAANRDVTGQGSKSRRNRLFDFDASRRDRSRRELCPAPLGSSTSCRSSVVGGFGAIPSALETPLPASHETTSTARG